MRIAQWVVALPKPKQIVGTEKWWSPIKKRGGCTNEFPVRLTLQEIIWDFIKLVV